MREALTEQLLCGVEAVHRAYWGTLLIRPSRISLWTWMSQDDMQQGWRARTRSKHAVLVVDKAAWHLTGKLEVPENISIVPLPPYSLELNPVEQIWQQLRRQDLANRCFKDYEHIVDVCCEAWNKFAAYPCKIHSLCTRKWVTLI